MKKIVISILFLLTPSSGLFSMKEAGKKDEKATEINKKAFGLTKKAVEVALDAYNNGIRVVKSSEGKINYFSAKDGHELSTYLYEISEAVKREIETYQDEHYFLKGNATRESTGEKVSTYSYKSSFAPFSLSEIIVLSTKKEISHLSTTIYPDLVWFMVVEKVIKKNSLDEFYAAVFSYPLLVDAFNITGHYPFLKKSPLTLATDLHGAQAPLTRAIKNFMELFAGMPHGSKIVEIVGDLIASRKDSKTSSVTSGWVY